MIAQHVNFQLSAVFRIQTLSEFKKRFSHLIDEFKIHHLYSLITNHDDFDNADPSRMQDACHIWTQLNDFVSISSCSSVESGDREVLVRFLSRTKSFFFCPTLVTR